MQPILGISLASAFLCVLAPRLHHGLTTMLWTIFVYCVSARSERRAAAVSSVAGWRAALVIKSEIEKGAHALSDDKHLVLGYLDRSYVLRLEALRALRDVELYSLALLQAAEAACLNRREMHEDIFAILTADEAKTFRVVKPLHCSCFHWCSFFYLNFLLRRVAAGEKG